MVKYLAALHWYKCKNVQTLKQLQISTVVIFIMISSLFKSKKN